VGAGGHDVEDEAVEAVFGGVVVGVVHELAGGAAAAVGGTHVEAFDFDSARWRHRALGPSSHTSDSADDRTVEPCVARRWSERHDQGVDKRSAP
jgi:hypothetical protein